MQVLRLQLESLLEEASVADNITAVERLLEHERNLLEHGRKSRARDQTCEERYSVGLVKAAESGNCRMIKVFLRYNYTIPPLHTVNCACSPCQSDKLGQTTSR